MLKKLSNIFLIIVVSFVAIVNAEAQALFNNNGAQVTVTPGGVMIVRTNSLHNIAGNFDNAGTVTIEGNVTNDANLTGLNLSGIYRVQGNWINNNNFRADFSKVFLYGANQYITGSQISKFWDLTLQGSGVKTQTIDAETTHELDLTDRELATDINHMWVSTSNPSAVLRTSGFVSSLGAGSLRRTTFANVPYLFPTGSSVGVVRYRPIIVTPNDGTYNEYGVRLANTDATLEGFDRSAHDTVICDINPRWYHRIYHPSGNTPADLTFHYDPTSDGDWQHIAHWQNQPRFEAVMNETAGASGGFNTLTRNAWTDFGLPAFALANPTEPISLTGPTDLCRLTEAEYTATGGLAVYNFYINGQLVQASSSNIFTTTNLHDNDTISVVGRSGSCVYYSNKIGINIRPYAIGGGPPDTTINRGDGIRLDVIGGVAWSWTPTNTLSCSDCQSPIAFPDTTTTYVVVITHSTGCQQIDSVTVRVKEDKGIDIFIPNTITPNGDGSNDTWVIRDLESYPDNEVIIVNRWGDEVFNSKGRYRNNFDGRYKDKRLPDGTYYYVLKLKGNFGSRSFAGPITILQSRK